MPIAGFDPASYLAANPDLLRAGYTASNVETHYTSYGVTEGRSTTFNSAVYLASNPDLIRAGLTTTTAVQHYISFGYTESRTASFSASSYMAANSDLNFRTATDAALHYVTYGYRESRTTTFDFSSLDVSDYMSSYTDLQSAFGSSTDRYEAAIEHYRNIGIFEGRRVTTTTGSTSTSQTSTSLTPSGTSQTASLSFAGERDSYAVTLTAGTQYTISMSGSASNGGTLSDPYLRLYNRNSQLITQDDDSGIGADAEIVYTPTSSGTYYITAGSFLDRGTGTYTLALRVPTSTTLTSTTGDISLSGERDSFSVSLLANARYRIDLRGSASNGGTLSDPYLRVYDRSSTLITYDDDSGEGYDSQVFFTPTSSGLYTLQAAGYGSSTGSYSLSVSQIS